MSNTSAIYSTICFFFFKRGIDGKMLGAVNFTKMPTLIKLYRTLYCTEHDISPNGFSTMVGGQVFI